MKKLSIIITLLLVASISGYSQKFLKLGDNSGSINSSALLDLESTNKGLLLPRVSLTSASDVSTISSPAIGLIVYNLNTASDVTPGLYVFVGGGKWNRLASTAQVQPDWDAISGLSAILNKPILGSAALSSSSDFATVSHTHSNATISSAGFMSALDKSKLDGLSNFSLPTADATTLGGVKIGSGISIASGVISVATNYEAPISSGTLLQYWRGDKSWQSLNSSAVGLENVNNTTDLSKPVSTATQTELDLKENLSNKSTTTTLGTSDLFYPTQNAVKTYVDAQIGTVTVSDATTLVKGRIQLAGDLGGTAELPTVPGLISKAPINNPTFTGTVSGITKSMVGLSNVDNTADASKPVSTATQTALDLKANLLSPTFTGTVSGITKSMVGLSNVDNTADANKPISTATQTALDSKENTTNKSTTTTLGTSDSFYPTQNAVKTYVDAQIGTVSVSDATTLVKGRIQLAGDLGGTAASPTVPGLASKADLSAFTTLSSTVTSNKIAADATASSLTTLSETVTAATNLNTINTIVKRDASGNFSAGTITAALAGNATTATTATTVTTNANLSGPITSSGNTTSVASQTGTGSTFVMDTSPTLTTPNIGAATGTSLSVTGSLTSTVAAGTAPLFVTSTTPVANLSIGGNAATATTTTNLAAGVAGSVPYQSAANTTAMTAAGTTGQVLQSNGASAPGWVDAGNMFISGSSRGTLNTNTTNYADINGTNSPATTLGVNQNETLMPRAGVIKNLYVDASLSPGGSTTYKFTIFKNYTATTMTISFSGTTTSANTSSNPVTFAAGDTISIQIILSNGSTNNPKMLWALNITN